MTRHFTAIIGPTAFTLFMLTSGRPKVVPLPIPFGYWQAVSREMAFFPLFNVEDKS